MTKLVLLLYSNFTMSGLTTISSKGQIVVPQFIRRKLDLRPSDTFRVSIDDSRIIVEKIPAVEQFLGKFVAKKVISKKDIKNAARKRVVAKHTKPSL